MFLEQQTNTVYLPLESGLGWIILEGVDLPTTQIEIDLPDPRVYENTTFDVTAYFRNRATAAESAPTTIHYRIDDLSSRKQIRDWTSVSASGSVTITISASDNAIQDDSKKQERRQITVKADDGLSTQAIGAATWVVRNLVGSS